MKLTKRIIAVLLVLLMVSSMFVACRKSDDDDIIDKGNNTTGQSQNGEGENTGDNGSGNATGNNGDKVDGNDDISNPYSPEDKPALNIDENPITDPNRKVNKGAAISIDVDKYNLVKNTKLSNLKGKTLTFYYQTVEQYPYVDEKGKSIGDQTWMKLLKSTYGLTVKVNQCAAANDALPKSLVAMNSGKPCDLITTCGECWPQILNVCAPLENHINTKVIGTHPSFDPNAYENAKWKGKHRLLGATMIGCVKWYNKNIAKAIGLTGDKDPHTLFKKGKWNWENWEKTMAKCTTYNGKKLYFETHWGSWQMFPASNGVVLFKVNGDDPKGSVTVNFGNARCTEAWTFQETAYKRYKNFSYGGCEWDSWTATGVIDRDKKNVLMWEDVIPFGTKKGNLYDWVPWPAGPHGKAVANGVMKSMGLPKKTKTPANNAIAVKFIELWCTRIAETCFDLLGTEPALQFSYDRKKEFYNFIVNNSVYTDYGTKDFQTLINGKTNFTHAFVKSAYTTKSEAEKVIDAAKKIYDGLLSYGE